MVKYTLYFMIQRYGKRVYYVAFGTWLAPSENVVVLMHGIITRYHYLGYKRQEKIPLFFDSTLKCWAIENPYNDEYYKTIETDRSLKFVTWLHMIDGKELFSNESTVNAMVSDRD